MAYLVKWVHENEYGDESLRQRSFDDEFDAEGFVQLLEMDCVEHFEVEIDGEFES